MTTKQERTAAADMMIEGAAARRRLGLAAVAIVVDSAGNATIASDIEGSDAIASLLRGCADTIARGKPRTRHVYRTAH